MGRASQCSVVLLMMAACTAQDRVATAPSGGARSPAKASEAASAMSASDAATDAAIALGALAPLAFGTRPARATPGAGDTSSPFVVAIDGPCPQLGITLESDRTLVYWGDQGLATLATLDEHGVHDVSAIVGANAPSHVLGHWPDMAWYVHDEGNRCMASTQLRKWTNGQWKDIPMTTLQDHPGDLISYTMVGDGLLYAASNSALGCADSPDDRITLRGDGAKIPQIADDGAEVYSLAGFPTGEVFAMVRSPRGTEVRFASAGGNVQRHAAANGSTLTALAPDDAYVMTDGAHAMHFDGHGWSPWALPSGAKEVRSLARAPDKSLWAVTDNGIARQAESGAWSDTTAPGKVRSLVGVPEGAPWIVLEGGTIAKYEGGTWTSVLLPKPPFAENATFSASSITVRDARDVWVEASYRERVAGWGKGLEEKHSALLRTIAADETLRCGGSLQKLDYAVADWGFESWPSAATDECTTPLLLLNDRRDTDPPSDFPRSRALLANHPEFVGTVYQEIAAGAHHYLAAKTPNVQMARAILAFYAKKTYGAMPHIVCADPPAVRVFDVASDAGAPAGPKPGSIK